MSVDRDVVGHGEQPRANRSAGLVEGLAMTPGSQHGLLHDVFSPATIPVGQSHRVGEQRSGVRIVKLAQRNLVFLVHAAAHPSNTSAARLRFIEAIPQGTAAGGATEYGGNRLPVQPIERGYRR
jgi:hypothetical protein